MALSLLAYNLGNLWRRLVLPQRIANWSLTSLQRLVENRWPSDQACALLLAAVSREPPDAAAVWQYAAADGRSTVADWVGMARKANRLKSRKRRKGVGEIASERSD